jgi:hypothetical protein
MSDMGADKPGVVQAEHARTAPRKRGFVGHCARFWWAYLLGVVVVVVVVVPVV